jgi:hypothetical protein
MCAIYIIVSHSHVNACVYLRMNVVTNAYECGHECVSIHLLLHFNVCALTITALYLIALIFVFIIWISIFVVVAETLLSAAHVFAPQPAARMHGADSRRRVWSHRLRASTDRGRGRQECHNDGAGPCAQFLSFHIFLSTAFDILCADWTTMPCFQLVSRHSHSVYHAFADFVCQPFWMPPAA